MQNTRIGRPIPGAIDVAWLRRRFASAPLAVEPVYGDQDARPDASRLKAAAVLLPIFVRPEEPTVLLTRRTAHLRVHSGQISFPGGRVEARDASPEATAVRETHEEIGLPPASIELLGRLADYHTRTGFRVTPVVGLVTPPFDLSLDAHEVDEAFEVPLSFLLDPANHQRQRREFQGRQVEYYAIPYRDYCIWGATAGILVNFYRHLAAGAA
ncbi:MAG: CoA pyrophosphatase [Burkholderiales bacterium]